MGLDDQSAFGRPDYLATFGEDELDQTGVATDLCADLRGFIARNDLVEFDDSTLCLRDDLLRTDDDLSADRLCCGADQ